MRLKLVLPLALVILSFLIQSEQVSAQNFSFNCSRDTLIPGCSPTPCFTLRTFVPDIKESSATYTVNPVSPSQTSCAPVYSSPAINGTTTNLTSDDLYSNAVNIGFDFPFYGIIYDQLVISTNGALSFDASLANTMAHYGILNVGGTLDGVGGIAQDLPSALYNAPLIMGPYHDIDITIDNSPTRRIQYTTVGAAPNRKWVLSFYRIPLYSGTGACDALYENTSQIILNEGTGIVEVIVFSRQRCTGWNQGRAMIGMQNENATQAIMAPGRRASDPAWGGLNMTEAWRFVPSSGNSLFKRAELYDLAGNLIPITANVTALANGTREVLFPGLCPPAGTTTTYIVKSVYAKYDNPALEIAGFDTLRVVRSPAADLNATATSTVSACGATGTGSITVAVPVGVGATPYTYSLTNAPGSFQTSNVFNNVAAGNYTVYVRDAGSCSSTIPVSVASSGTLNVTFTTTPTSCVGADNGTITVLTNGLPPIEYSLNGGPWVTNNVFTGLQGASYLFNIRDAAGCVANNQWATIPQGTGTVTGNLVSSPTSCPGVNDGSITATPSSGSGPYDFSINNGTSWQTSGTFNGLATGNYSVIIREAALCRSTPISITVSPGAGLQATLSNTPTTCAGVNNGTIIVTATTGTGPYTAVLDGTTTITGASPLTFTGVSGGVHNVTITDAPGCSSTSALSTTVGTGSGYNAAITVSPTSCSGVNDGSLAVSPQSPGVGPFTYTLNPGAITQTAAGNTVFTGLAPNSYTVLITDANGCQHTSNNLIITQGLGLAVTLTPAATTCAGINNGRIDVTSNGTAPFTFVLDGTITQTSATNSTSFINLSAGNHTITATDANGCTTTSPVATVIATGTGFTATHTSLPATCAGASDAGITASIQSGGVAPFSFVLNGITTLSGNTTATFAGLPASTGNTIVITDAVGCTFTINNITVTQPVALNATAALQPLRCNGEANGTITVTATGGTGGYSYALNAGPFQASNTFNAGMGNYSVSIRDANNCVFTINNLLITQPSILAAGIVSTGNATCEGGNNGTIVVSATGGTAPYQYSIDGISFQSSSTLLVAPGNFTVYVKDANGCSSQVSNVLVGLTNNLQLDPIADPPAICEGVGQNLSAVSNATQFTWSPSTGLSNPNIANPVANPSMTTLYTVSATLGRCSTSTTVTVSILPAPTPDAGPDGTICYGQSYQLQASGGVSYTWTPGTNLNNTLIPNPQVINPVKSTTYQLSVIDTNNCQSLVPDEVQVIVTPPIKINLSPADTVVYAGAQFQIIASSPATSYTWSPATGLNNPFISNPLVTAPAIGDRLDFQVVGTTDAGCRGEAYATVRVYKGPDVYVPNAFTPNNDGNNDRFIPFPVGIKQLSWFSVFNRWGQLLFTTTTLNMGWDGKSAGADQAAGVYVWMIQAVTDAGETISRRGTVTLIR